MSTPRASWASSRSRSFHSIELGETYDLEQHPLPQKLQQQQEDTQQEQEQGGQQRPQKLQKRKSQDAKKSEEERVSQERGREKQRERPQRLQKVPTRQSLQQQQQLLPQASQTQLPGPDPSGPGPSGPKPPGPGNDLYQPRSFKFWLTLLCNFLALFLVALDRTILSTAIPRITDEFKSLGDIGWYGSAYMLTTASSQLLYGRVYKFYDMKWVFLFSILVFEAGSALCGAAPSSNVFIAGRAIAGHGSAGIFTGCMLIMIPMVPLHKRPMFQGMFGMVFGVASAVGPVMGGAFTDSISWRWCFYINLPIGAFTLAFMILFWNPPKQDHPQASIWTHIKRLDPLGTFFFLPAIVSLLLALQWGGSTYAWNDRRIIALFVTAGCLLLAFAAVEVLMPDTATVPPRVITQRSVICGAFFSFFTAGSMLMMLYYLPVWFQTVKLVEPLRSGIYTLPVVLSLVVASILSGICTQKLGYYVPAMLLSPSVMAVGEGLMSTFDGGTTTPHWVGYQFPAGFGIGLGMQVSGLAMQTVLPPPDISTGIAIMFFGQQLGGAVFTSVGQTILSNLLASRLSGVAGLDPRRIVNEGATNLVAIVPPELMGVVQAAYNYACTRIFLAAMGLTFAALICALMMEWRSIKKGKNGQGPPGSGLGPGVPAAAQAGAPLHSELAPRSLESVDLEAVEVERITEEKFKDGQWTDASSQRQLS